MNSDITQRPVHHMMPDGSSGPRAFPISADEFFDRGMLLRDYFAAAALTGLLAWNPEGTQIQMSAEEAAGDAYSFADAMLLARRAGGHGDARTRED